MEKPQNIERVLITALSCIILLSLIPLVTKARHWPYDEPDFPITNISINGNNDLLNTAEQYGWPGAGTIDDPIRIEGLEFYASAQMFVVAHTDLYFVFANNTLDGVGQEWCAIVFWELENALVADNLIMNANVGIHFVSVNDTTIFRNTICNSLWDAIYFENQCFRNNITCNSFYDNSEAGIYFEDSCQQNMIMGNDIHRSGYGVILSSDSDSNAVEINYCHDLFLGGLSISTRFNEIVQNHINDTDGIGISLSGSQNLVLQNCFFNNSKKGVRTYSEAHETMIANNVFLDSGEEGVFVGSNNNSILENDFISNGGEKQASDNGENNTFEGNHWDDWTEPDLDEDGFVDQPYSLAGSSESEDSNPRCQSINIVRSWTSPEHPVVTSLNEGDILAPTILVVASCAIVGFLCTLLFLRRRRS